MIIPLEITFHRMDPSPALRANIRRHAERLERFAPDILSCHVVVEELERHQHKGNRYEVRLRATVPGGEFEAGHTPRGDQTHTDPYVAVRDAFRELRRQLQDFERKRRGDVKTHEAPRQGKVLEALPDADFGTILDNEGREIRFERNAVVDYEFDRITPGQRVTFTAQMREDGPWASTVHVLHVRPPGKPRQRGERHGHM